MFINVNKTDLFRSQFYKEHFTLYLIFCWIWDNLTNYPAYTEPRPLIWVLSHYSTPCQTPKTFWGKFAIGNYIIRTLKQIILISKNNTKDVTLTFLILVKKHTKVWKPSLPFLMYAARTRYIDTICPIAGGSSPN
jgi:hypothetical protein